MFHSSPTDEMFLILRLNEWRTSITCAKEKITLSVETLEANFQKYKNLIIMLNQLEIKDYFIQYFLNKLNIHDIDNDETTYLTNCINKKNPKQKTHLKPTLKKVDKLQPEYFNLSTDITDIKLLELLITKFYHADFSYLFNFSQNTLEQRFFFTYDNKSNLFATQLTNFCYCLSLRFRIEDLLLKPQSHISQVLTELKNNQYLITYSESLNSICLPIMYNAEFIEDAMIEGYSGIFTFIPNLEQYYYNLMFRILSKEVAPEEYTDFTPL